MCIWGLSFLREFLFNARCASSRLDLAIFNPICSATFTSFHSFDSLAVRGPGDSWGFSVQVQAVAFEGAFFTPVSGKFPFYPVVLKILVAVCCCSIQTLCGCWWCVFFFNIETLQFVCLFKDALGIVISVLRIVVSCSLSG